MSPLEGSNAVFAARKGRQLACGNKQKYHRIVALPKWAVGRWWPRDKGISALSRDLRVSANLGRPTETWPYPLTLLIPKQVVVSSPARVAAVVVQVFVRVLSGVVLGKVVALGLCAIREIIQHSNSLWKCNFFNLLKDMYLFLFSPSRFYKYYFLELREKKFFVMLWSKIIKPWF